MFKKIEKPLIHIFIPRNCSELYYYNIEKIIMHEDFDTIIIDLDSKISELCNNRINCILSNNEDKNFFIRYGDNYILYDFKNVLNCKAIDARKISNHKLKKYEVIFLQFKLKTKLEVHEWKKISKTINNYPEIRFFIEISNSKKEIGDLDFISIFDNLVDLGVNVYLSPLFKDFNTIVNHPCNIYLCETNTCHVNKSAFPRYIYITPNGAFPYLCVNSRLSFLKDISKKEIKDLNVAMINYRNSFAYKNFIRYNKLIYTEFVMNRIFTIYPWNIMLEYTIYNCSKGEVNANVQ